MKSTLDSISEGVNAHLLASLSVDGISIAIERILCLKYYRIGKLLKIAKVNFMFQANLSRHKILFINLQILHV